MVNFNDLTCCNPVEPCGVNEICCPVGNCGASCEADEKCCVIKGCCPSNAIRPIDEGTCFTPSGQLCTTESECFNAITQAACALNQIVTGVNPAVCTPGGSCDANSLCYDKVTQKPCTANQIVTDSLQCVDGGTCTANSICLDSITQAACALNQIVTSVNPAVCTPGGSCDANSLCYDKLAQTPCNLNHIVTGLYPSAECTAGGICNVNSLCYDKTTTAPCEQNYIVTGVNPAQCTAGGICNANSLCYDKTIQAACTANQIVTGSLQCIPGGTCSIDSTCCDTKGTKTNACCAGYLTNDPAPGASTCKNLCLKLEITACKNGNPSPPLKVELSCWETGHGSISELIHSSDNLEDGLIGRCATECSNYGLGYDAKKTECYVILEYQ